MIRSTIIYMIAVIIFASLATPLRGQVAESSAFDTQEYLFTSIDFVDSLRGWLAGETVLRTTDGGRSWHPPEDSSGVFYYGIDFIDPLAGWGAGGRDTTGVIVHSTDGGKTWETSYEDTLTERLKTVTFLDSTYGWAAGGDGVIVHTRDGGMTWQRQESGIGGTLDWITFVDTLHGWTVGQETYLLRTEDGGKTWVAHETVGGSTKVVFFDQSLGYILTDLFPVLLKTTDGGKSWEVIVDNGGAETGYDLFMLDSLRAWVILDARLIRTQDGFATGTSFGSTPWRKIYFLNDGLTGWGFGTLREKGFGHTLDGGRTWTDGPITSVTPAPGSQVPQRFILHQNYPNPFNPETEIRLEIPGNGGQVTITVYDILGRKVKTLLDRVMPPGEHRVVWDGMDDRGVLQASGIFLYRVQLGGQVQTRKMLLLR